MTQRNRSGGGHVETVACERYMARMLHRELQRENAAKPSSARQQASRLAPQTGRHGPRQQNFPSQGRNVAEYTAKHQTLPLSALGRNMQEYDEDDGFVEVTVKTANPRAVQRARSAVEREPWGQVLSQQRGGDEASVFGSFDPLRTLHFLAKELQIQLQNVLPDDNTVQQMVSDIQHALKRVPPEIVSSIHLQQALSYLPINKTSQTNCQQPEKLKPSASEKDTQTFPPKMLHPKGDEDKIQWQKLMEENTQKLEESCKTMELVCTRLKNEKEELERELKELRNERDTVLIPKITSLEKEKRSLKSALDSTETVDLKKQLASKNALEDEFAKLKHQLRISAIEKEKYVAILAVRDRQIAEIRGEMAQLQDAVNEQLSELRGNAGKLCHIDDQRNAAEHSNIGDTSISTIYSNEDRMRQFLQPDHENSFRDLPSGDPDASDVFQKAEELLRERKDTEQEQELNKLERFDSQASIRSMFKEIKKTAYAAIGSSKNNNETYGE